MDIQKSYSKKDEEIRVTLEILFNQLFLFVGENGSGKSTTIKLISRVIFPTKGGIENQFQKIVYLPDKRSYPKLLKVKTYLRFYLGKSVKEEQINFFIKRYHIPNKFIGKLSKGMLQKLGIVQTILFEGDLYLFDEPTDGLDTDSIVLFKEDIQDMLKKNKTVIISTHNKALFKEIKPRIYHFKQGGCYEKR